MANEYSMECIFKIWCEETGESFVVCEDADVLGMLEIRSMTDDNKIAQRVSMPAEVVPLLLKAVKRWAIEHEIGIEG